VGKRIKNKMSSLGRGIASPKVENTVMKEVLPLLLRRKRKEICRGRKEEGLPSSRGRKGFFSSEKKEWKGLDSDKRPVPEGASRGRDLYRKEGRGVRLRREKRKRLCFDVGTRKGGLGAEFVREKTSSMTSNKRQEERKRVECSYWKKE